ncbi:hypothetical protein ACTFIY_005165 [Dictyostelium cf. discoideum]
MGESNNILPFIYNQPIEIDKELECSICFLPLLEPVVEQNCGSMFCNQCLLNNFNIGKSNCPSCKQIINQNKLSNPPKIITNKLDELSVYCIQCKDKYPENEIKYMTRLHFIKNHAEFECKTNECGCHIISTTSNLTLNNDLITTPTPTPTNPKLYTKIELKHHKDNECILSTSNCSANNVSCPWYGHLKDKDSHESTCSYISLKSHLLSLQSKISQLESEKINSIQYQNFLETQINQLESKLSFPISPPKYLYDRFINYQQQLLDYQQQQYQQQQQQQYQQQPYQQPPPQQQQVLTQYNKNNKIFEFSENSFKYVNGVEIIKNKTKSISLGSDFNGEWPKLNEWLINTEVDTIILLDGFRHEIHVPISIKTLHIGNIVVAGPITTYGASLTELHLHDGCSIKLDYNQLPKTVSILHIYNINNPYSSPSSSLSSFVKPINQKQQQQSSKISILHLHDGFSIEGCQIPNSLRELHLYDIKVQSIKTPINLLELFLHDGFNLPLENVFSKNITDLHLFNIKSNMSSSSTTTTPPMIIGSSIKNLFLRDGFNQDINIPPTVKWLCLFNTQRPINIPKTIKKIYLQNYNFPRNNFPNGVMVYEQNPMNNNNNNK